jgi:hypothetical protein
VLPKWDHGQPQQLTFEKVQDRNQRLVLRLWSTGFQVATVDGHKSMLWNGMATMERLDRVAGLVTLTHTDSDFVKPRQQLTDSASAAQLAVEIRQRGSVPVALIW